MGRPRNHWFGKSREKFLEHLAKTGNPGDAAITVGKTLLAAFRLLKSDAEFAAGWALAKEAAAEQAEAVIIAHVLKSVESGARIDDKIIQAVLQRREPNRIAAPAAPPPSRRRVEGARAAIAAMATTLPQGWQPPGSRGETALAAGASAITNRSPEPSSKGGSQRAGLDEDAGLASQS